MSDYRRAYVPGGCYFFTVVTFRRQRIFTDEAGVDLLRRGFRGALRRWPFGIDALVVLPDHLHSIWRLPTGDADFSGRWRYIKQYVSSRLDAPVNRRGEKLVWQRRFWEHAIRDEDDWQRHLDYVHYNPVKHGLAASAWDWPYSSFRNAVDKGWYARDWGRSEPRGVAGMALE